MPPDKEPQNSLTRRLYVRMFIFALIGFILFFSLAWFRLYMNGTLNNSNPYAGPPSLLTCLSFGGFGLVIGAITGLFKKKS